MYDVVAWGDVTNATDRTQKILKIFFHVCQQDGTKSRFKPQSRSGVIVFLVLLVAQQQQSCVPGPVDVNTVMVAVERLVSSCGGLTLVMGRHHDINSSVTARDSSQVYAVFTRETVSRCHIEPGSVIAVHPPWLSSSAFGYLLT